RLLACAPGPCPDRRRGRPQPPRSSRCGSMRASLNSNSWFAFSSSVAIAGVLLIGASVALGGQATTTRERSRQVDVNPGETNPCNGSTGTITDNEQDVFHITTLDDGTYRLSGHSTVQVSFEPDDASQPSYT